MKSLDKLATAKEIVTTTRDGKMTVSSRKVAEVFQKEHKNVLRDIRAVLGGMPGEFGRLNLELGSYLDEQGQERPEYRLTKDGFLMIAMGFTGQEAMKWKENFIKAFNLMESELHRLHQIEANKKDEEWRALRTEVKFDFSRTTDILLARRKALGKETPSHVYSNDARLLQYAVTGNLTEDWDRDNLSKDDQLVLRNVERHNVLMIAQDVPYADRKARCRAFALEQRELLAAKKLLKEQKEQEKLLAKQAKLALKKKK